MEGSGVVNYDGERRSYAISAETTQFDDELIRRGIVTCEQAIMAKGATPQQAKSLMEPVSQAQDTQKQDDNSNDSFSDSDDEFLKKFRAQRLQELKLEKQERDQGTRFGSPVVISRNEWTREVNEASQKAWVIICLTSSDTEKTGCMERAVQGLAKEMVTTKFVMIPVHQAIENWPLDQLPTLFLYRHGKMQKQLDNLRRDIAQTELCSMLKPFVTERSPGDLPSHSINS